ncbi:MAG: indole-3-glycerol phosphate synthase TrpC [Deltaproteobacteria bacterium]|nr:indole-3-glycerol phosphate synthase TrpC [Deltaproteobacteria bacterium]
MILDDIVRDKRADLEEAKRRVSLAELQQRPLFREGRRPFLEALRKARRAIVAEVKKASPSKGVIRESFDPVSIARAYAAAGAAAISVLTEERYFQGHLNYLAAIRESVDTPLLRKDFLFDPYQLYEARAFGADAALLIVASLSDQQLQELIWLADELNLVALVEVHDRAEMERATHAGARLIGINNRDLRTFHTTLETTELLVPLLPKEAVAVAESGIDSVADIERLERCGVHAFLVGERLMRAADPGAALLCLLSGSTARR